MPLLGRRPLVLIMIGAAILGQIILRQSAATGIAIMGLSLAALLAERWWYPVTFRATWLSVLLLAVFGYLYAREPLGWFFLAGLVITVGTSIRAHLIYLKLHALYADSIRRRREELATVAEAQAEPDQGEPAQVEPEPAALAEGDEPQPAPLYWRALLFGLIAATVAALIWLIAFRLTGWQIDLVSWLLGMLVGRAVLGGAGDQSTPGLQACAALLGGLSMLGGHYLILRETLPQRVGPLAESLSVQLFATMLIQEPVRLIGIWSLLFIAVGVFSAWHGAAERK